MDSKDELKKIDVENRTFYYFDDIMTIEDIYYSEIFSVEKKKK